MCLCVCVYLSESLLGGSPPLSMYALEGAVECPQPQGCFVVYVLYMVHSVYVSMCLCVPE